MLLAIWEWANKRPLLAIMIVVVLVITLGGAVDGISARRAASKYFDLAKGWAAAYQRDTAASKKEYEAKIKALTTDRDAYKTKYEAAKRKMNASWVPPKETEEMLIRFRDLGYQGVIR